MTYQQVMLDVDRCAGRFQRVRQVYFHRRAEDDESAEDLTEELELDRISEGLGRPIQNLIPEKETPEAQSDDFVSRKDSIKKEEDLEVHHELKSKLAKLIVKLLEEKPQLHYYQGFHDVCLTYMMMLGEEEAYKKLDKLVDSHFSTFMQPTMNEAQEFMALIPILLELHDWKVGQFFEMSEVGTIFALSWVITWFSHDIRQECDVEEIFKFLEKEDPHFVLYLCAEIVMLKRDELLKLEPEMSTVHHFLCQVPRKEKLPIQTLLEKASHSFIKWSPELLKQKLEKQRSDKLRLQDRNVFRMLVHRFSPTLSNFVTTNAKTAIFVFVVASAIALQIERWSR